MAAPIGPGDWVECIDNIAPPGTVFRPSERLTVGAVYQVGDCWVCKDAIPALALVGRERVGSSARYGYRVGYALRRFRPAFRPEGEAVRYGAVRVREGKLREDA